MGGRSLILVCPRYEMRIDRPPAKGGLRRPNPGVGSVEMKRLVLCLDGTWNKPDDNTNVYRAWQLISDTDAAGRTQRRYYHPGVGTKWWDRFLGGLTGYGLDTNLRDAYQWLVGEYEEGDTVY